MTLIKPEVTFNIVPGSQVISNAPQKVLIVGQKNGGSASSGELKQSIQNNSEENTFFGENSMIAAMIRAFKVLNKETRIDAIGLDDNGGGVDATGTVVFTGPATEAGTLNISVGSIPNHTYEIAVADTDTATILGDKLEAAITADTKAPVSAANVAGTVTLTAVNAGTVGNGIGLKSVGTVAGVTVVLTAMASGATDPVLTTVFDVVVNERYQTVVAPFEYGTDFLTDFLDPRENVDNRVLDGEGIMTSSDTFANLQTLGSVTENSKSLVIFGVKVIDKATLRGPSILELTHVTSSYFAAVRSLRLTTLANVSNFVVSTIGSAASRGGIDNASLPYHNTPIDPLPLIDIEDEFTDQEWKDLSTAGIAQIGNNQSRQGIILGTVTTTRSKDASGNEELTFRFLNAVDTSSVIREFYVNNSRAQFVQTVITPGDLVPNRPIANPGSIRAFMLSIFESLQGVLIQAGEDARQFYDDNLFVTLDALTGIVTVDQKVPIVGQLREITGQMQIVFSTNN